MFAAISPHVTRFSHCIVYRNAKKLNSKQKKLLQRNMA